jgi:hypothetical protein
MRNTLSLLSIVVGLGNAIAVYAAEPAGRHPPDVYVVGSLHDLHETEEAFGYATLQRIIETIRPDVLAMEVRPDEAAERKDTPGRPEYPKVVWPLLRQAPVESVPLELGDPQFSRSVETFARQFAAFEQAEPSAAGWWSSYQSSLTTALHAHWRKPADTHDRVTEDLARSYYLTQYAVLGGELKRLQEEWDEQMVQRACAAVRAHPGRKVLVLVSYRNRHRFLDAIRQFAPDRLVDMERWLQQEIRESSAKVD